MVLVLCIECWNNTGNEMHPAKKKADIIGYHRMIMTYENAFNLNSPNFSENQTTLTLLVPWFGFLQPLLGVV